MTSCATGALQGSGFCPKLCNRRWWYRSRSCLPSGVVVLSPHGSFVERRRQCSGVYNWVAGSSHPPLRSKPAWPSSRLWFFVVSNELNKLPLLQLSGNIFLCLCAFDFSSKFIWLIWSYVYLLYNINEDTVIAPAGSDYLLKLKICMLFLNEIKMLNNLRALGRILSSCFEIDLITQNDISLVLQ